MERYTTKSAVIRGEYRVSPATTENCIEAINKLGRYEDAEENKLGVNLGSRQDSVKVIGNIHSNPELLEVSE